MGFRTAMTAKALPIFCLLPEREDVYECFWTGAWVRERDVQWTKPVMPGVKFLHAAAPGHKEAMRDCARAFLDSEAGCNSCRWFERTRTDSAKGRPGCAVFIYGECGNPDADLAALPYRGRSKETVMLHPDDWMGMPCYESRFNAG